MKKKLLIILTFALTFCLTSCFKQEKYDFSEGRYEYVGDEITLYEDIIFKSIYVDLTLTTDEKITKNIVTNRKNKKKYIMDFVFVDEDGEIFICDFTMSGNGKVGDQVDRYHIDLDISNILENAHMILVLEFNAPYNYESKEQPTIATRIRIQFERFILNDEYAETLLSSNYLDLEYVSESENNYDSTQVAKIVTDYEQKEKEKIAELKKTEPEMIYYFNPIDRVRCTFVFEDSDSVNRIIEEYDTYNVFKDADINNFDSIKMLMIIFTRDNFTEGIYQKINQIKDNETSIKELYINFESAYIESYMPNINYYIDEKVELNYEIEKRLFNLTWEKGFIIRSKEEYDAYLDYLLEIEDFEPIRENINSKKDLYDETFFEENALIISSLITRGSGSIKLTLDNIYISNDKVYIVVRTDEPEMGTADIKEATFAFIVKQSDILNVNEVVTLE